MAWASSGSGAGERRPAGLGGVAFGIYRLLWLALFAAAVASIAYFHPRDEVQHIRQAAASFALSFNSYINPSAEGMLGSAFDKDGERFGYREGDLLLSVDGRRLPVDIEQRTRALSGPPGSIATLVLRHQNGEKYAVRVARDPGRLDRAYAGWGITFEGRRAFVFALRELASIAALIAAAMLFLRRPHDPVAQLLSFSLVLGRVALAMMLPGTPEVLLAVQPAAADVLLVLAILLFPSGRFATRWHVLAFASYVVSGIMQVVFFAVSWAPEWSNLVYAVGPAFLLLAVARQLQSTPAGIERQQAKFLLFGIVAFCLLMLLNIMFVQLQFGDMSTGANAWIILFSHLSEALAGIAIPAGLLVSLLRFRLYDAETAISRSVAYGALTLALLAIFAGSEKIIEVLGEEYFGEHFGALAGGLGAAVAAVMVAPLHHRVTHWAERRFQGDLIHLRKGLPMLVGDMRETATPEALADAMLARVESGVRAAHGAVVVQGEVIDARHIDAAAVRSWLDAGAEPIGQGDRLHADRADPLFPMRVPLQADGVGLVGWLLLGPRPDGSFYGKDERETLLAIADPVARGLAIARDRQAKELARHEEVGGIRERLAAVERWLEGLGSPQSAEKMAG